MIKTFTVELTQEYPVKLNAVGDASYATLYLPFDVKTLENTTAYYIKSVSTGEATLTAVTNNEIAANTAVVLINNVAVQDVVLNVASGLTQQVSESENYLKGTLVDMTLDLAPDNNNYSLGRKKDSNGDYQIGFYKFNSNGNTSITLGANKAYLQTASEPDQAIKGFTFNFGGIVDSIDSLERQPSEGVIYDLAGRRIAKPARGLYIVNGKKVAIK